MSRHLLRPSLKQFMHHLQEAASAIAYFDFDAVAATFTAGMAKRVASGPFAAAPIVQGDWNAADTADVLSYGRGSQISENFYANNDTGQGTIVFWITPEWNGNDGVVYQPYGASGNILIAKTSANNFSVAIWDGSGYR
jgi:hypothetical protein